MPTVATTRAPRANRDGANRECRSQAILCPIKHRPAQKASRTRCPFRKFLASFLNLTLIRPWRIKVAFKLLGPWTKPCAPLPLLTAGLTERSRPHQRCPGVSPTVRMGMAPVIVFDIPEQSRLEICHRSEIASLQEPPSKHAEP